MQKVLITNIQRFSVHDGPGIRTTVFAKGCSLRCAWCQNPENLLPSPELLVYKDLCIKCRKCEKVCKAGAIYFDKEGYSCTDRSKCVLCGLCTSVCFSGARIICGTEYSVDTLFKEIVKDRIFFKNSAGGITLSGGDFIRYPEFTRDFFKLCRSKHINTAIETSGYAPWDSIILFAEFTDLFLYDLKIIDSDKHLLWTGVDNHLILENLNRLAKEGFNIIIRIPLIPGVNDEIKDFKRTIRFIKSLKTIKTVHLLPFHNLGLSKYNALDLEYKFEKPREIKPEKLERYIEIADKEGLHLSIGGTGFLSEIPKVKYLEQRKFIYKID